MQRTVGKGNFKLQNPNFRENSDSKNQFGNDSRQGQRQETNRIGSEFPFAGEDLTNLPGLPAGRKAGRARAA
jgi:hypothetical protein